MKNTYRKEIFMDGQLFYEGRVCIINQAILTHPDVGLKNELKREIVGCHATLVEICDDPANWHLFRVSKPNGFKCSIYLPLKLVSVAQSNKLPVVNKIRGVL